MSESLRKAHRYDEVQVQYLYKEIDDEARYQGRVKEEKTLHKKGAKRYFRYSVLLGSWAYFLRLLTQNFKIVLDDWLSAIRFIIFMPIFIFSVAGLIFCIIKFMYHAANLWGTIDRKTYDYKSYSVMLAESEKRKGDLQEELVQVIVNLEAVRNSIINDALDDKEDENHIDMEEVYKLKDSEEG